MELEAQKVKIVETADELPDLGERYEVIAAIGSGGMADVYKIRDKQLDKIFAAKIMKQNFAGEAKALGRFADEVEAASAMTHGNIAAVYSHGVTSSNVPFLCMDYLEGETLADILARDGQLPPRRAVLLFQQICEALIHAHMKGIVHRDLKPSNIFITKNADGVEVVKLVDFGIAKQKFCEEDSTKLTQTGDIIGTPMYMSPEQCKGTEQDARSDIYSVGCVMYHALTGKPPFAGPNSVKIILQHVKEQPKPLSNVIADDLNYLNALENCVLKCLEKEPEQRYQQAEQLLVQLQSLETAQPVKVGAVEARVAPGRRIAASAFDAVILTMLTHLLGILLFPGVWKSLEVYHAMPHWQVVLMQQYCDLLAPLNRITMDIFAMSALLFLPIFLYSICLAWSIPLVNHYGCALLMPCAPLIYFLYSIACDASPLQGTFGKRIFGLIVVDEHGKKISLAKALHRCLMQWLWPYCFFAKLAITPISTQYNNKFANVMATIWDLVQGHPAGDAYSGAYVVNNERRHVFVSRNKYVPDAKSLQAEKLHAIRRQWKQSTSIILLVMDFAIVTGMFYLLAPASFKWLLPLFLPFFLMPWIIMSRRMKQLTSGKQIAKRRTED